MRFRSSLARAGLAPPVEIATVPDRRRHDDASGVAAAGLVGPVHEQPAVPGDPRDGPVYFAVVGRGDGQRRLDPVEPAGNVGRRRRRPNCVGAAVVVRRKRRGDEDHGRLAGEPPGLPGTDRAAAEHQHGLIVEVVVHRHHRFRARCVGPLGNTGAGPQRQRPVLGPSLHRGSWTLASGRTPRPTTRWNGSAVNHDVLVDVRTDGTLAVDGEAVVRDGAFALN
jgi:hypothetical protein